MVFDIDTSTAVLGNLFNLSLLLYLVGIGLLIVGMRTRFCRNHRCSQCVVTGTHRTAVFFAYPFIFR